MKLKLIVQLVALAVIANAPAAVEAQSHPMPGHASAYASPGANASLGPTMDAASVGIRNQASAEVTAPAAMQRVGAGQNVALMVVGGAALLLGLIIGGDEGAVIAIAGAAIGLYGLYRFVQ